MAHFEARQRELSERFTAIQGNLPFEEVTSILFALKEHARLRDEALVALAEIVADKGDNKREGDFTSRLEEKSRPVVATLNNMLDRVREPSLQAMAFRDLIVYEEQRFFETLKTVKPAEARDIQMRLCHDCEWLVATLKAKWSNLSDTEKQLLEKERYYAGLMNQTVKTAFETMVAEHLTTARAVVDVASTVEQLKSKINDWFEAWVKETLAKRGKDEALGPIITEGLKPGSNGARAIYGLLALLNPTVAAVAKGVGALAKAVLPIAEAKVASAANEMRYQMIGSQRVAVEFSETRRQANEYLRTNGYEQAKEHYARSRTALDRWAADQGPPGLKSEAEAWVKWADAGPAYFLEEMRKVHAGMLSEFEGIFMNGVSDKTVDALTDRPFFQDWHDGIERMDFDERLKALRAQVITLSGDVEAAFARLETFSSMPVEGQYAIKEQVRAIREQVLQPFTREMQEALRTMDAAQNKPVKDATRTTMELLAKQREMLTRH